MKTHARSWRTSSIIGFSLLFVTLMFVGAAADRTPNDPKFTSQYGPQLLHAPAAWSTTFGASETGICFVDSGVRRTHEDLSANYRGGIDFINGDTEPWDDHGHGSRTAGIAVATINNAKGIAGIANVPYQSVKAITAAGIGESDALLKGIRWCADNGAQIISLSIATSNRDPAMLEAVEYAWGKGLLLIAGTGNGACSDCVQYPAAFDHVLAVGCVDSNRVACNLQSKGSQVDLTAPGLNILTTGHASNTAYVYGSGTSMSAPHVAGAAALLWGAYPRYTNQKVRDVLLATAQDIGPVGWDSASGAGIVRPDLAIAAGAPSPSSMAATFTVSPNVNEWWVEVKVTSANTITKVDATVEGKAPVALSKNSWGTWSKSFNVPRGSHVVFKATDATGATASSPTFTWMGTTTPAPATTPATFTATFEPRAVGNDWWVETFVTSSTSISKVEAREDGGAWILLSKTSWGTWAKSIHVENGHRVEFRATATTGATATSAAYVWT